MKVSRATIRFNNDSFSNSLGDGFYFVQKELYLFNQKIMR
jgi:hypothetical protein